MSKDNDDVTDSATDDPRRWSTVFDLVVFQCKLLFEGLKDILLGPLSIIAAAIDLAQGNRAPDRYFDRVLRLGERFEKRLDLYNLDVTDSKPESLPDSKPGSKPGSKRSPGDRHGS